MAAGWKVGLILSLAVATAACSRGGDEKAVRDSAAAFYNFYLKNHPAGVPNDKLREQLQPLISAELSDLLNDAAVAEAAYAKETKGESPPLVEGDLFTSLFEGAESYMLGACKVEGDAASCAVDLGYTDKRDNAKSAWQDRIYLIREEDKWVVDDIEFLGTWEFMHKGKLKDLLRQVADEAKDPASLN
ncbi:MAG TPA: DUF3828 domain-containing protein [Candidatus Binatia bacterium]